MSIFKHVVNQYAENMLSDVLKRGLGFISCTCSTPSCLRKILNISFNSFVTKILLFFCPCRGVRGGLIHTKIPSSVTFSLIFGGLKVAVIQTKRHHFNHTCLQVFVYWYQCISEFKQQSIVFFFFSWCANNRIRIKVVSIGQVYECTRTRKHDSVKPQ